MGIPDYWIKMLKEKKKFETQPVVKLWEKDDDQVLAFKRGSLVFVFNFNPFQSFTDYGILAPGGEYEIVMTTDNPDFGGYGNVDETVKNITQVDKLYKPHRVEWLKMYLPARTAIVLRQIKKKRNPSICKRKCTTKSEK